MSISKMKLSSVLRNTRAFSVTRQCLNSNILKGSDIANGEEKEGENFESTVESNKVSQESTNRVLGDIVHDRLLVLDDAFTRTRGKKRKPERAKFLVLNPKQAGLLRKRNAPEFFKRRENGEKLSVLEGVELGNVSDRRNDKDKNIRNDTPRIVFNEIEKQRKKLLVFKSSVSKEQAVRSISYQKPSESVLSKKRYEQLFQLLDSAYTLPQLRAYTRDYYNAPNSKSTKPNIIRRILDKYWNCTINDTISESQDLIMERIIDISTRDMYLLLLTSNGKILNNFARIGATLAVAIDENVVIVRATAPIIKYVEVSLNRILSNVNTLQLPVKDIITNHTAKGTTPNISENELVAMVQKGSASYFERSLTESKDDSTYNVSAFGSKRLLKARNLLLWGVDYHPQLEEKVELCCDVDKEPFRSFPFTNVECFDWIKRDKGWHRLQQPVKKNVMEEANSKHSPLLGNDAKLDEWYDYLTKGNESSNIMQLKGVTGTQCVFSLTLGQILSTNQESSGNQTLFEPKVTQIASKLLKLPLYDSPSLSDEYYAVDQHEYYVQLKLIPDLSTVPEGLGNAPPLELWFELDDYDAAVTSTVRCILPQEQRALLLQTPHLPQDYRINLDRMVELIEPPEEAQENWLAEQPGIKNFIQNSELTFGGKKKLKVARSLEVNVPIVDPACGVKHCKVQYDYVNANYHRVLKLIYMDKYVVQFSDVKGGSLGGRYTQVDFIGGEMLSRDEFKQFIKDVGQSF